MPQLKEHSNENSERIENCPFMNVSLTDVAYQIVTFYYLTFCDQVAVGVKPAIPGAHTSQDLAIGPAQDAKQTILQPGQPVTDVTRPIRAEAQARTEVQVRAEIRFCQVN